jgi:hypothetical protein
MNDSRVYLIAMLQVVLVVSIKGKQGLRKECPLFGVLAGVTLWVAKQKLERSSGKP